MIENQVVELYKKLRSYDLVAQKLHIPKLEARRILISQGIEIRHGGVQQIKHDLPMDEVVSRYLAGETCKEIANSYSDILKSSSKPHEVVRRRLRARGIARRPRGAHGKRNFAWKGKGGYQTMHYYRRLSYEVAAICQGKPLTPGAVVNHFDENPKNCNPENLCIFPTQGNHWKYHLQLQKSLRAGLPIDAIQTALENGAVLLQRPESLNGIELNISQPDLSKMDLRGGRGRKVWKLPANLVPLSESIQ